MESLVRPARRRSRLTLWPLRAVLAGHLLAVLVQPVLAGQYLTGDVDAIGWHATIGSALAAVALLLVAVAVAHALVGRGAWWVPAAALALFLADGFQIGQGYERALEIHIPLGVAIVLASVLLTVWSWSPASAHTRGTRTRGAR